MRDEVLNISNLSFRYKKDKLLYKSLALSLHVGEIKAIVGESGAGKTTLFELIVGNLKPLSGSIACKKISQVFQDPYSSFHPSYTIIQQIKDVAQITDIDKYLSIVDLEMFHLQQLPHELSGGQLQRASIIRALLMKPQLLLLDEPTSALDNIIQLNIMKMLITTISDIGILLITHDLDLAKWCADEIYEL